MANPPAPRRLLAMIALAVLLIVAAAPAVSAGDVTVIDENFEVFEDTSSGAQQSDAGMSTSLAINAVKLNNIENFPNLHYISVYYPRNIDSELVEGNANSIQYTLSGETHDGVVYVDYSRNAFGGIIGTRFTIFLYDWDVGTQTGSKIITFNRTIGTGARNYNPPISGPGAMWSSSMNLRDSRPHYFQVVASKIGTNTLEVTLKNNQYYTVELKRIVNDIPTASYINLTKNNDAVYSHYGVLDVSLNFYKSEIDTIQLTILGNSKAWPLSAESTDPDPAAGAVTVYIQNSQTGALIANAQLSILAAAGDPPELYEVVNATLPGGTGTYTLQPTGGGSPNPDYYRAVATVPGYSQIVENHSFTLNGPHDVIIEMRPDTGGPLDPNLSYLEFYVRDIHANPISSASVQCDGRIKQTNSQGYAVFEVSKNATYPYVAKKSGYVTIEGTATVADGPRYVVNVVLGPGSVPTYTPTSGPGETPGGPGATPTPDHRSNEQKGQAVIDMIADNAEGIGALALICLLLGLLKLMVKW